MLKKIGLKRSRDRYLKIPVQRDFIEFKDAKTAGILFIGDFSKNGVLQNFVKELNQNKIETKLFEFRPKVDSKSSLAQSANVFTYKDFGTFGTEMSEKVKKFTNSSFDYLFCLNTSPFLPFENILSQSKAKCRVGVLHEENSKCFELAIGVENNKDLSLIANEMLRYVKIIRKRDERLV